MMIYVVISFILFHNFLNQSTSKKLIILRFFNFFVNGSVHEYKWPPAEHAQVFHSEVKLESEKPAED